MKIHVRRYKVEYITTIFLNTPCSKGRMATLRMGDQQQQVQDGERFIEEAKELGVLFGCEHGLCGTCRIEVLEGMENLSERTPEEIALGCEGTARQACQCRILKGMVVIRQV